MAGRSLMLNEEIAAISKRIGKHARVAEFGTFHGETARRLAEQHPTAQFVSIDLFVPPLELLSPEQCISIWFSNKRQNMNLFIGTPQDFENAIDKAHPFDVIIVDGDHSYEGCLKDLCTGRRMLAGQGVLLAHDYKNTIVPGVTKAIEEFCSLFKITPKLLIGELVEIPV